MLIYSWGMVIDVNVFENGLGKEFKLLKKFVKCFIDVGMEWGGGWLWFDGMYF